MSENAGRKKELIALVRELAYKEGKFILASGKESTFYVDIKNLSLHPKAAKLIGQMVWDVLDPKKFAAVGGPTLGADPLTTAISLGAFDLGHTLPGFIIRKEPKKHGTSQWIEGRENLNPSRGELLLIEDVVTTGGSSIQAIEKIRNEGFTVNTILCVMNREEQGEQNLSHIGVKLVSLVNISEVRGLT